MLVETFECQETAAEPIEATEEAVSLMEELGLTGQMLLVRSKSDVKPVARSPYRQITEEESFVYSTLCPSRTRLDQYSASPIPLRVLQIASHVKSLGICKYMEVWDKTSEVIKDPVLIGCITNPQYDWDVRSRLILARWGEVLETFPVLLKRALDIRREQLIAEATSIAKQAEAATHSELMKHSSVSW